VSRWRSAARWASAGLGIAAGVYAGCVGMAWRRYGSVRRSKDRQLDRFMPRYEVVERRTIRIAAPASVAFTAACNFDLTESKVIQAIFRTREMLLGSKRREYETRRPGMTERAKGWGWGVLSRDPGREIVFGAVTQPWQGNPEFRAIAPEDFVDFCDPGLVKIAWMLRVDPIDATTSSFSTETRAIATDAVARAKFRRYWAFLSPGIRAIRIVALRLVKAEAERSAFMPL
jgi:hypothetical protein